MSKRSAVAVACVIFFGYGLIISGIGPALPELAARTASSLADLGGIFTAVFFGALVTQLVTGPITDRMGQRPVMLVGLLLLALGTFGATWSHLLFLTFSSMVFAGFGAGTLVVTNNLLAAQLFPERNTSMLNLVNVFYGIGAVLGPLLAGQSLRLFGTALLSAWAGAALLLLLVGAIIRLPDVHTSAHEAAPAQARPVWQSPALWMLGALAFLYGGMETGIGGWATVYMQRTTAQDGATAALTASAFWLALTGGRMIGTFAGMRITSTTMLTICIGLTLGGALLLRAGIGNALLSTAAVVIIGLAFGPIYPTTLAFTAATFRRGTGTATSVVMALASTGGMFVPWLLLGLLERGPAYSTLLIVAGAVSMLALHIGRGLSGSE
jgi:MFS transporter, FHS family, L-fucose permease